MWLEYGRNVLIILMLVYQCHTMNKKAQGFWPIPPLILLIILLLVYQCHHEGTGFLAHYYHVWLEYGRNVLIILLLVYQCHAMNEGTGFLAHYYHVWLEYGRNVLIILLLLYQCHAMNKKAQGFWPIIHCRNVDYSAASLSVS